MLTVVLVYASLIGIMIILGLVLRRILDETTEEYYQRHEARRIALENLHDIVEL